MTDDDFRKFIPALPCREHIGLRRETLYEVAALLAAKTAYAAAIEDAAKEVMVPVDEPNRDGPTRSRNHWEIAAAIRSLGPAKEGTK